MMYEVEFVRTASFHIVIEVDLNRSLYSKAANDISHCTCSFAYKDVFLECSYKHVFSPKHMAILSIRVG